MTEYLRRESVTVEDYVDIDLFYELTKFYYREADLLDEGRYVDWLECFDDDLLYWAPTRTNRLRRQQALSISDYGELAFYDETKESLAWRIRRFDTGMAWAEDPPSRTRHLITNLTARHGKDAGEAAGEDTHTGEDIIEARTNFLLYRTRLEHEENLFAGTRTDVLRKTDDGFKIYDRRILLDVNVLKSKNISTFF